MFNPGDIVRYDNQDGGYVLVEVVEIFNYTFDGILLKEEGASYHREDMNVVSSNWSIGLFYLHQSFIEPIIVFETALDKLEKILDV